MANSSLKTIMTDQTISLEKELRTYLIGKKLNKLMLNQVNVGNIVFEQNKKWLIDGGVELDFGDSKFSFGWDSELELFQSAYAGIHDLTREIELRSFNEKDFSALVNLRGLEITDISTKWNFYCNLDEYFQPLEEKNYILKEIILTFQKTHKLQISTVDYDYIDGEIRNFRYGAESEILVILNADQEIEDLD